MLHRAIIGIAMIIGTLMVLAHMSEQFHPAKMAASVIKAEGCKRDGWGDEICRR